MPAKFTLRVYEPSGELAFGATLHCRDAEHAIERFNTLPVGEKRADLLKGGKVIAQRNADAFATRTPNVPVSNDQRPQTRRRARSSGSGD